jgi:hypothetical protein
MQVYVVIEVVAFVENHLAIITCVRSNIKENHLFVGIISQIRKELVQKSLFAVCVEVCVSVILDGMKQSQ